MVLDPAARARAWKRLRMMQKSALGNYAVASLGRKHLLPVALALNSEWKEHPSLDALLAAVLEVDDG